MANSFLFIVALTPEKMLSPQRVFLRRICFEALLNQSYGKWKALLIGMADTSEFQDEHFLKIEFEGHKEEKLQVATKYILDEQLKFDYVIRLDDDDLFNPNLLKTLSENSFDLYVDKYHCYWDAASGKVSQYIRFWLPNTCIHKFSHALTEFGKFPPGDYKRFKSLPFLIENEHNDFHHFYNDRHKIVFSEKNKPVYIRTLNPGSITSLQGGGYSDYLNQYGFFQKIAFEDFPHLSKFTKEMPGNVAPPSYQSVFSYIKFLFANYRAGSKYHKLVIHK